MIRLTSKIVAAVMAVAMMAAAPATAGTGVHATTGTATIGAGTVSVTATEPGLGTAIVNGTPYQVVCMKVSPFQAAPGGTHDIFIKAISFSSSGTAQAVYIRILDFQTGVDRLGFNFVGLTFGIACDADQNVAPVLSGNYATAP